MGKRQPICDVDFTFAPKISEASKKIVSTRESKQPGIPNFMLETKSKLNYKKPLGPIPVKEQKLGNKDTEGAASSKLSEDTDSQAVLTEREILSDRLPRDLPFTIVSPSLIDPKFISEIAGDSKNYMIIKKRPSFDSSAAENNALTSNANLDSSVFTFKPSLSNASLKIVENLNSDFMSRQQQHLENQRKHVEKADTLYKKSVSISPQSRRNSFRASKDLDKELENTNSDNENEKVDEAESPVNSGIQCGTICEEEEEDKPEPEAVESSKGLDEMPAVNTLAVDRMKTTNSAKLQRLLEGPYASPQDVLKVQQKTRFSHPGIIQRPIDADKENESPACLSRSKTMPSIARSKLGRKLSLNNEGERLRNAKEIVDKAIKYRKVFTIQGGYASVRNSLRKRGWVEKFYKTTGFNKRPSRPKRRKQNSDDSDSDGAAADNDGAAADNDDDDDAGTDDDDGTDDDNDEPKIPPWEEEDGLYGIMSRMVRNVNPQFFWVLKRDVIDYRFLLRDQMVNHYCKAGSFTTKVGLCVNLRNVRYFENVDQDSFCPRCYRLSHEEDKEAFIEDYRLSACMNIVKIMHNHIMELNLKKSENNIDNCAVININSENQTIETVKKAQNNVSKIQSETLPETDKIKPVEPSCKDPKCAEITKDGTKCVHIQEDELKIKEDERKKEEKKNEEIKKANLSPPGRGTPSQSKNSPRNVKKKKKSVTVPVQALEVAISQCEIFLRFKLHEDIDLLEETGILSESQWNQLLQWYYQLAHDDGIIPTVPQALIDKCEALMKKMPSKCPQFELDGVKNVWIVKPGAKSRGRGIVCYDKLEDMLKLVNSNVVRKDSKYVVQKYIERPLLVYNTKFDIRQWFLVTDWNPLTIWFYQDSYLRFCSQQYTLDDFDESIHLSNNAIQKHYKNGPRSNQLPDDNMWTHEQFKDYLKTKNVGNLWDDMIYPGMKKAIQCALLTAQDIIEYRKSSFELYGADFMLTEDYAPWLIEINSSPSMEASTAVTARMCNNVLDDTIKVVIDRKQDRNCDIGRFELSYKQPIVTVPPYIGINLQVEGSAIRKPFGYKKVESVSPQTSRHNVSEKNSATALNNESKPKDNVSSSNDSAPKKDMAKKSPTHGASVNTSYLKQLPKCGTNSVEASESDCKVQSSLSDTGISRSQYYKPLDMSSKHSKSGGATRQPEPPSQPKLCLHTPYVSVGNRRIVSKTSVSMNYSIPGSIADKPFRPAVSVKNVETTDFRHIKAQKGKNDSNLAACLYPVTKIKRKTKKTKVKPAVRNPKPHITLKFPKVTYLNADDTTTDKTSNNLPKLKMFNLSKSQESVFRPNMATVAKVGSN
ncbi:hypothetical protein LOTGIDRAFT_168866 [Lottia gigantea]|uniref:ATP-grasp domain-containing protein n=1 Tax=Lottia gigantea TaxID=225164 RepID=V3ZU19_LOTGI|nr:hypothetical protein LOTGIDRAFT_168866 [Lottia gigantea]ESO84411.1 hypothetical protein LOTGIDRAFT_168866 [Lottia gigantea]